MNRFLALILAVLIGLAPVTPAFAQSGGNCSVFRTWTTGDSVTASDLNSSFTTVGVTNFVTSCMDGLSDSVANMQSTTTPYSSGTESQATSLAGELQRIRYVLQTVTGWPNWYRVDLPISLNSTTHIQATAMHVASRGSLRFPSLTFGGDHTTGLWSPAAHHLAIGFDATSNQGVFGLGQTNARSWIAMHARAVTFHHTLALRYAHSTAGMNNGQYGHVTVLRVTSGSTTDPNALGFFEGNDQVILGHEGATLKIVGGGASHVTLGSRGYLALGRHVGTLPSAPVANALYADTIAKAWAYVDGDPSNVRILNGFNVASVRNLDTGQYLVTWVTPFVDANYPVFGNAAGSSYAASATLTVESLATTHAVIRTWSGSNPGNTAFSVMSFGRQ